MSPRLNLQVPSLISRQESQTQSDAPQKGHPVRFLANNVSISVSSVGGDKVNDVACSNDRDLGDDSKHHIAYEHKGVETIAPGSTSHQSNSKLLLLNRFALQRSFGSWRWHARQRYWKKLCHAKDDQIMFLLSKVEESQHRGVAYCQRQRRKRIFGFWRLYLQHRKDRNMARTNAVAVFHARLQMRSFQRWRKAADRVMFLRKVQDDVDCRHARLILAQYYTSWRRRVTEIRRTLQLHNNKVLYLAFCAWRYGVNLIGAEAKAKSATSLRLTGTVLSVFSGWLQALRRSQEMNSVEATIMKKDRLSKMGRAFAGWHGTMHLSVRRRLLEQSIFSIHTIDRLVADNKHLAVLVEGSLSAADQAMQLREASEILRQEKETLQALLSQVRPLLPGFRSAKCGNNVRVRDVPSKQKQMQSCPDVFLRLYSGQKREKTPVEGSRSPSVAMSNGHEDAHDVEDAITPGSSARHSDLIGRLATSVVSISDGDFFSVLKQVDARFQELGFLFTDDKNNARRCLHHSTTIQ
jgi:hypothetical protein